MAIATENVKELFLSAAEMGSSAERAAFLERACIGNEDLRRRVEALLKAHERPESILDHAAVAVPMPPVSDAALGQQSVIEGPGTVIGPYKLLEQIGEGGFGVVFMAEQQQPVRRKVALKVIKPGMDTRQVVARFEAERQALALMDHPNISQVFDGGETASGRPYFVMELVRGIPLTDFCDQSQLTVGERLQLFLSVCQAVQHAHQKGIIHRDLKPTNVLVTLQDGAPLVKVIDFGIAKATGEPLTEKTLFTNFAQMIGTPLYMSPEQSQLSAVDVDTRSDIYSLGVMLYELLTGTTPFDKERLRSAAYDEIRRIIREEEPAKPSTRLSTMGQPADTASANRQSDVKRLSQLCRGELDWIVMKALAKDRNQRYETAAALAADVQRYLHDEPVLACPPSTLYRLRKLARQNKAALLTGIAVTLAMVVAVIGLAASNVRIVRQKAKTDEALADAEANLGLARAAVDDLYTKLAGEVSGLPNMQGYQRELLQKALQFYEEFAKRKGSDPDIQREAALARLRVGQVLYSLGQRRQGEQAGREALAALERLAAGPPPDSRRRLALVDGYAFIANALVNAGPSQEAEVNYGQALRLLDELARERPEEFEYRWRLAVVHNYLGTILGDRPLDAENHHRQAIRLCEELLAAQAENQQHWAELAQSHRNLGILFVRTGRLQEAEGAFRISIEVLKKTRTQLNSSSYRTILPAAKSNLAQVLAAGGPSEEAEQLWRDALRRGNNMSASSRKCQLTATTCSRPKSSWPNSLPAVDGPTKQPFSAATHTTCSRKC